MKTRVLYIEDEPYLGKIVRETLENQGYEVEWETDGARVMDKFKNFDPRICILDIMLPNVDGYELCRQIRSARPGLPVIFLTAKTETEDLVRGFEAGGTDYMRKPFSIQELIVRIENQLQLLEGSGNPARVEEEEIRLGRYRYFPGRFELYTPNGNIRLSHRDGEILSLLCASRNRVIERKEILLSVWGDDSFFNSRNLDVYIRKIREYLKHDPGIRIQTLKGKGYLFLVPQ